MKENTLITTDTESTPDKAGVIVFPPFLYLGFLVTSILISYFLPSFLIPKNIALVCGCSFLIIAVWILLIAVRTMNEHKTTIHPSGATKAIVTEGIYKHSRNPMYVSFTLIYLAFLVMNNAWWGLLLLIPLLIIVQKGIIEKEEQYLTCKFGDEYLSYKNKVRRWL